MVRVAGFLGVGQGSVIAPILPHAAYSKRNACGVQEYFRR